MMSMSEYAAVDVAGMVDAGWRAAAWLANASSKVDPAKVWQVVNAADVLAHPELFPAFPAFPAKKTLFIQKVARAVARHPAAPARAAL